MPPLTTVHLLQPDRVSVSMKFTKQPAEFESVSAQVGVETNLVKGETVKAAFKRAAGHVQGEYDELLGEYARRYKKKGGKI